MAQRLRLKRVTRWPRMEQGLYRSYRAVHPFDERFGVETSGLLYDLRSGHQHDVYNNGYFAVAPSVFHAVMRAMLEQLHLDCHRFCFVDVGSGKGRALLLASDYPFRKIIGVELSPELDRIARANIARYEEAVDGAVSPFGRRRSSPYRAMQPSSSGRPDRWSSICGMRLPNR